MMMLFRRSGSFALLTLSLAACSVEDSMTAHQAQGLLLGMTQPDLEACLGVPSLHSEFGDTTILTWTTTSTAGRGLSLTVPVIGGFSLSGGGSCNATARLENGRVTEIRYSGEDSAFLAPDAYCAPIVRSCLHHPEPRRGAIPGS
jgi:hypothetical protein